MSTARRLAGMSLLLLFALQWLWHAVFQPPTTLSALGVSAFFSLPLLPALALYWRGHRHAGFWAAVTALLYFCHGVMEAWSDPGARPLALSEALLAALLIVAASWDGMQARFAGKRK